MYADPDLTFDDRLRTAVEMLHEYADMVEEHGDDEDDGDEQGQGFGLTKCKYNLHLLLCRLPRQVVQRGPSWLTLEYWIERAIQVMLKHPVSGRVTSKPEPTMVRKLERERAIRRGVYMFPGLEQCRKVTLKVGSHWKQ